MARVVWFLILAILLAEAGRPALALDLERRRMLTASEHVPWRGVGRVNVAGFRESGMCTGTLVDEDLVITAAHCVISEVTGRIHAVEDVYFVAGWRRGQKVASRRAAEIIVHPSYAYARNPSLAVIGHDLAVIRLDQPISVADAPFFRVGAPDGAAATPTIVSYRRDRPHALTRQDGCDIGGMDQSVILLNCDVTFGASGSPVFADVDGSPRIIAVISAKGQNPRTRKPVAYAVRVDRAMPEVLAAMR